jgi:hypothetical protein
VKQLTGLTDEELAFAVTNKNVKADQEDAHLHLPFDDCNKKK